MFALKVKRTRARAKEKEKITSQFCVYGCFINYFIVLKDDLCFDSSIFNMLLFGYNLILELKVRQVFLLTLKMFFMAVCMYACRSIMLSKIIYFTLNVTQNLMRYVELNTEF